MNKKEKNLDKLDKAGWNAFYNGGMKDIRLYSETVGAVREIKEIQKNEEISREPEL